MRSGTKTSVGCGNRWVSLDSSVIVFLVSLLIGCRLLSYHFVISATPCNLFLFRSRGNGSPCTFVAIPINTSNVAADGIFAEILQEKRDSPVVHCVCKLCT